MCGQMTIFDLLSEEKTPEWTEMTLKEIASYIGEKTGLHFIPDTRFHGEFNEYIAYRTNKLFFTVGFDNYSTYDDRNGKKFIGVGYENKKDNSGGGAPCDNLEEAVGYFSGILRRLEINVASRKHESGQ